MRTIGISLTRLAPVIGLLGCLSASCPADADDKPSVLSAEDLAGRVDLAVPEAPAFSVLGVSPQTVIRPTSGKDLAISLLSGVDYQGNAQPGLALDTRPWMLAFGDDFTLAQYQSNTLKRQLARMRLSFATTAGQSDADKADRYAIGLTFTPWDDGDPRSDEKLLGCYRDMLAIKRDEPEIVLPGPRVTREEAEAANSKAFAALDNALAVKAKDCVARAQKRNWNAGAWEIGLAGYTANADTMKESGGAAWTSASVALQDWGQFIAHACIQNNELVPDANATAGYRIQNSGLAGGRLRLGNERGSFMLEGSYADIEPDNASSFNNTYVAAGVEYRLMEGLWLELAVADTFGDNPDANSTVVSGQLRWGFLKERLLGQP